MMGAEEKENYQPAQFQLLRARLLIRNYYSEIVVKEIYDNLGQELSLVRIRLSQLKINATLNQISFIETAGEMVGQTIRQLRQLGKMLFPETMVLATEPGMTILGEIVKKLFPYAMWESSMADSLEKNYREDQKLLIISLILEVLTWLHFSGERSVKSIEAGKELNAFTFVIECICGPDLPKTKSLMENAILLASDFIRAEGFVTQRSDNCFTIRLIIFYF